MEYSDSDDIDGDIYEMTKNEKSAQPNKKKQIKAIPSFLEYFEAFRTRNEFLVSDNPVCNALDFTITSYSNVMEELQSNSKFISSHDEKLSPSQNEKLNKINNENLYELICELIKIDCNVFLYGFGSKLKLIYDFISYFQDNVNSSTSKDSKSYYILVFNCYNPELNLKAILCEIEGFVIHLLETNFDIVGIEKSLKKTRTTEEHIQSIKALILQLENKGFIGQFLLIFNNIDGPNFSNQNFQSFLSNLSNYPLINVLATCDNMNISYLWTQTVKDNFGFYFLKFNTFEHYEVEISDFNSLTCEKGLRNGYGLSDILKSFSKGQKDLLKELGMLQLKEDYDHMTLKGIVDYLVDKGTGICNNQNKFNDLILEALDHEIVVKKKCSKNNKEIYKLNLDKEIITKLVKGEYD